MAELVDAHDSKSCFARSESSILSSPTKKYMKMNKINNLLELFYHQYEKQNKEDIFLQSLKDHQKKYSMNQQLIKKIILIYKFILKIQHASSIHLLLKVTQKG